MGNKTTTYAQLKPVSDQWAITIESTKGEDKTAFIPSVCDKPAFAAPCNQPPLNADSKDKVRITATLSKPPLKTVDGLVADAVVIRLCFSKPFVADRPWRKPSEIIDMDKSCQAPVAKLPLAANGTYTAVWAVPKGAPRATWYAQVLVQCQNGTASAWCQTDSTKEANYIATQIIPSTPTSMKVAVAVCSAIAPAFLAAFFIKERVMKKAV